LKEILIMFNRILVSIDVEHKSSWTKALPAAAKLARDNDAPLHVMAVVPPVGSSFVSSFFPADYESKMLDAAKEQLAQVVSESDLGDIEVKMHLAHGTVYEEILGAANTLACDLIVLSAHRPELQDYLLGPNAARVVRHAGQSVLVVRD
jgi:nucleotide-binding universal stress UspA family protein